MHLLTLRCALSSAGNTERKSLSPARARVAGEVHTEEIVIADGKKEGRKRPGEFQVLLSPSLSSRGMKPAVAVQMSNCVSANNQAKDHTCDLTPSVLRVSSHSRILRRISFFSESRVSRENDITTNDVMMTSYGMKLLYDRITMNVCAFPALRGRYSWSAVVQQIITRLFVNLY